MTLEWLREQIGGLKKKLTSLGEELADLTNLDELLVSAIDNCDEAVRKINKWTDDVHENTRSALNKKSATDSLFGAYYLGKIDGILGDGKLDEAKMAVSQDRSKANTKLIETDDLLEEVQGAIASVKEKLQEFKSKMLSLFGVEE